MSLSETVIFCRTIYRRQSVVLCRTIYRRQRESERERWIHLVRQKRGKDCFLHVWFSLLRSRNLTGSESSNLSKVFFPHSVLESSRDINLSNHSNPKYFIAPWFSSNRVLLNFSPSVPFLHGRTHLNSKCLEWWILKLFKILGLLEVTKLNRKKGTS